MAAINSMYQYSLAAYLDVFNHSLKHSLPDSHLPKRLRNIIDTLSMNVYNYACTGQTVASDTMEQHLHDYCRDSLLICSFYLSFPFCFSFLSSSSSDFLPSSQGCLSGTSSFSPSR